MQAAVQADIAAGNHTFATPALPGGSSSCAFQRLVTAPADAPPDPDIADCVGGPVDVPAAYVVTVTDASAASRVCRVVTERIGKSPSGSRAIPGCERQAPTLH